MNEERLDPKLACINPEIMAELVKGDSVKTLNILAGDLKNEQERKEVVKNETE